MGGKRYGYVSLAWMSTPSSTRKVGLLTQVTDAVMELTWEELELTTRAPSARVEGRHWGGFGPLFLITTIYHREMYVL